MLSRTVRFPGAAIILLCIAIASVGCGSAKVPVKGMVTMADGTNLERCLVVFEGTIGDGSVVSARGEVAKDGSFVLSTDRPEDGVPLGKYKALVAPPPMVDAEARYQSPFNAKYSAFDKSQLEFEVTSGENNFEIKLTK